MPGIICGRCGRVTNTAFCDWVDCMDTGKAARCYAAWDDDKDEWVEGCAVNDKGADQFSVQFAKERIN